MLEKSKPQLVQLNTADLINGRGGSYRHLSFDNEVNEIDIECDSDGMKYVAQQCLLAYSGKKSETVVKFEDKRPRYVQHCKNKDIIVEYSHSQYPVQRLYFINADYCTSLKKLTQEGKISEKELIRAIKNRSCAAIKTSNIDAVKCIKIPSLEYYEYPNINKHKNGFLWAKIIDGTCYIIGNTRGLGFLLKHLIFNAFRRTDVGDDFHYHLRECDGQLDRYSTNIGIYNIDCRAEKFRKNYYKYR